MKIVTVAAQKGGVGKTTTAVTLAAMAQERGLRALLIDLDPQGSLTLAVGAKPTESKTDGVFAVLEGKPIADYICPSNICDIVTGHKDIISADGTEPPLRDSLQAVADSYDICIIDTSPQLGYLAVHALTAADEVIIPLQADLYALKSLADMSHTINIIRQQSNPTLRVAGVILTRYNNRITAFRAIREQIQGACTVLGIPLMEQTIRESNAIRESLIMQTSILSHAPKSAVAQDYKTALEQISVL